MLLLLFCCVMVLRPTNSLFHMEMGPQFKVSSERLEKLWLKLTTPVLQGELLNHYNIDASSDR